MKIEVGKLYKYVEESVIGTEIISYYFVTKVDRKAVIFYEITNPDYIDIDSLEWAIDYWREVC